MSGYRAMPPGRTGVWKAAALGMVLLCAACGGNSGGGPAASAGSGSLAYKVEWEPPPPEVVPSGSSAPVRPLAPVIDVCTDYGIDTVTMKILAGVKTLLSSSFPCSQHAGTLNNVPAGDNLVLRLEANVPGAGTAWIGDSLPFQLVAGGSKDNVIVKMSYIGTDNTQPAVVSRTPILPFDVEYQPVITVNFSERMAIHTVIDIDSIVLQDNASNPVPVSVSYADNTARIVPNGQLDSGVTHSVILKSAITDMAGKPLLGTPYQWSFKVHERGTWSVPLPLVADPDISPVGGGSLTEDYVSVAGSGNGDALVLWVQQNIFEGTPSVIVARRFSGTEKSWGSSVPLTVSSSSNPHVVMDNNGNAYAVFIQNGASWIRRYIAGSWEKALVISDGVGTSQPQVGVDGTGTAYMVWVEENNVYSRVYTPSGGLFPPRGITRPIIVSETSDGLFPPTYVPKSDAKIVAGGEGKVTYAWVEENRVWGARLDPIEFQSLPSVSKTRLSSDAKDAAAPYIAIGGNGDVFAVWRESVSEPDGEIWVARYPAGADGWDTASLVASGIVASPKVASDGSGNAFVVWEQAETESGFNKGEIWARRFDTEASTWEPAQKISTAPPGLPFIPSYSFPEVAADGSGNTFAVWTTASCPSGQVWGTRYDAASGNWVVATEFRNPELFVECNSAVNVAATRPGEAVAAYWSFPIGGEGGISVLFQSRNF